MRMVHYSQYLRRRMYQSHERSCPQPPHKTPPVHLLRDLVVRVPNTVTPMVMGYSGPVEPGPPAVEESLDLLSSPGGKTLGNLGKPSHHPSLT